MLRLIQPVPLVFAFLCMGPVAADEAVPKAKASTAQELSRQARELWRMKGDHDGALALYNQAVAAFPLDVDARLDRAIFFDVMLDFVRDEDVEKFKGLARDDYGWVADQDPDSVRSGVARDALTRLSGRTLIDPPSVPCTGDGAAACRRAESLWATERFTEAIVEYDKAAAGCPGTGFVWVNYADAYFGLGDYEKAKELFLKAIEVEPWNRSAHRFLADAESHLKNEDAAVHQSALAVVSDPQYEAAWASLRSYAGASARAWNRVYARKVAVKASEKDPSQISITFPSQETNSKTGAGRKKRKREASISTDESSWTAYGIMKASTLMGAVIDVDESGATVKRAVDPKTMTALEIERIAVRNGLDVTQGSSARFWSMMKKAKEAGFLDEAIFLHLLDEPLAKEYPAFRDKNGPRLVEYLETVIVPKR